MLDLEGEFEMLVVERTKLARRLFSETNPLSPKEQAKLRVIDQRLDEIEMIISPLRLYDHA